MLHILLIFIHQYTHINCHCILHNKADSGNKATSVCPCVRASVRAQWHNPSRKSRFPLAFRLLLSTFALQLKSSEYGTS